MFFELLVALCNGLPSYGGKDGFDCFLAERGETHGLNILESWKAWSLCSYMGWLRTEKIDRQSSKKALGQKSLPNRLPFFKRYVHHYNLVPIHSGKLAYILN